MRNRQCTFPASAVLETRFGLQSTAEMRTAGSLDRSSHFAITCCQTSFRQCGIGRPHPSLISPVTLVIRSASVTAKSKGKITMTVVSRLDRTPASSFSECILIDSLIKVRLNRLSNGAIFTVPYGVIADRVPRRPQTQPASARRSSRTIDSGFPVSLQPA